MPKLCYGEHYKPVLSKIGPTMNAFTVPTIVIRCY